MTVTTFEYELEKAGVRRKAPVGLVIVGQSNEQGQADRTKGGTDMVAAYPQAFQSQRNPAISSYLPGVNQLTYISAEQRFAPLGSPWCRVYDELWDAGYEPLIFNASVGSQSFLKDAVGFPRARANNANYFRKRRGSMGSGDPGTSGTITVQNGQVFELTEGSEEYALMRNRGPRIVNAAGDTIPDRLDYILSPTLSKKLTGASAPDFAGATTIGSTVVDGACVWTNIGTAAAFGYTQNQAFKPNASPGFDPFGILRRAAEAAQSMRERGVGRIIVYLCNGQSDAGATSATNYQAALDVMTRFFRGQGFEVAIGLSTFATTQTTAQWDALAMGRAGALANFAADEGVHEGANLYELMGSTEGQNGLTYNTANSPGVHVDAACAVAAGGHHAAAILKALG